ncbi:glutaredoxin-C9-like [Capsicum galapagoense]
MVGIRNSSRRTTSPSSPIASTGSSTMQPPRTEQRNNNTRNTLAEIIEKNAVIIVARFQCYMCFMLQTLMESLGAANYTMIQGEEVEEAQMLEELSKLKEGSNSNGGGPRSLPVVYIGGKFVGGVDEVLTAHAKCELVTMLRAAGAI